MNRTHYNNNMDVKDHILTARSEEKKHLSFACLLSECLRREMIIEAFQSN